jgi:hypothetical protein
MFQQLKVNNFNKLPTFNSQFLRILTELIPSKFSIKKIQNFDGMADKLRPPLLLLAVPDVAVFHDSPEAGS